MHLYLPRLFFFLTILLGTVCKSALLHAAPQQAAAPAPEVTKVEPPNWWISLTPEVLLLLSGHGLEATHVSCNLPTVRVTRTQATAQGNYLFVWLTFGREKRSGTAVFRITTAAGPASFELPLGARTTTAGKFQGLSQGDFPYFIVPRAAADANRASDKSGTVSEADDPSKTGAHFAGDLRQIRDYLTRLRTIGVTALRLGAITSRDPAVENRTQNVVDFYSIDPRLGSLKDLQNLVASAHSQNMKVILDLDLLHVSARHPWTARPPLLEWLGATSNDHGTIPRTSGDLPNAKSILETENPLVALYLLQNSVWWVETADLDGIQVTGDRNITSQFWGSWRAGLQKIYPHLTIVNE